MQLKLQPGHTLFDTRRHHLVITYDEHSIVALYIDGELHAQARALQPFATQSGFRLGGADPQLSQQGWFGNVSSLTDLSPTPSFQ